MDALTLEPTAPDEQAQPRSWWAASASFVFWSLVFGLAYTQAPLYYSNQNQYFLHGLAAAGRDDLYRDWLAGTRDPTPVFSALVAFTDMFLHEWLFYAYYLLILGTYFHGLVGIYVLISPEKPGPLRRLVFMTLVTAAHAGLLRLLSAQLFGIDYPWYLQAGVAGQYILGFGLQPSVFGVLLVVSLWTFLRGRLWEAATFASAAGMLHSTYLLGAAMLVASYMWFACRDRNWRSALLLGLWALVLVSPVVAYNVVSFAPASTEKFAAAQDILANFRIPHHADPERWFDAIAAGQVAWIALSIFLVRRSPLAVALSVVFVCSLLLSLVQVWTGNDTLALLFPWRTSAVLMPVATTIVLARLLYAVAPSLESLRPSSAYAIQAACWMALGSLVALGVTIPLVELGYRTNRDELALLAHVRRTKAPGDSYLLPVSIPKPGPGARGAASTNFTPAPRAGKSGHLIAIDLQRFRIVTGAPIYVDFKSIPYKDEEVLEWKDRLLWAAAMYADNDWDRDNRIDEVIRRQITHVVTARDRPISSKRLEEIYSDASYRLYRVK